MNEYLCQKNVCRYPVVRLAIHGCIVRTGRPQSPLAEPAIPVSGDQQSPPPGSGPSPFVREHPRMVNALPLYPGMRLLIKPALGGGPIVEFRAFYP